MTIAAQHDWACELKRDMTLALTREFRESGATRRRGGAREPPVCAGASRRRRRVVRRAGVRRRRGRDREGRRLRAVRGRAENLLAFTREAFDLDEEDGEKGKGKRDPGWKSTASRARGCLRARLGADGVPLGARFRRRSRGGGGDGVFGGKKGRGEQGARRRRRHTHRRCKTRARQVQLDGGCSVPSSVCRRRTPNEAFKTPTRWKTPCSSWSPRRDVVECGRVFIKMFTTRSPRHPRGFPARAGAAVGAFGVLTISPYSFARLWMVYLVLSSMGMEMSGRTRARPRGCGTAPRVPQRLLGGLSACWS